MHCRGCVAGVQDTGLVNVVAMHALCSHYDCHNGCTKMPRAFLAYAMPHLYFAHTTPNSTLGPYLPCWLSSCLRCFVIAGLPYVCITVTVMMMMCSPWGCSSCSMIGLGGPGQLWRTYGVESDGREGWHISDVTHVIAFLLLYLQHITYKATTAQQAYKLTALMQKYSTTWPCLMDATNASVCCKPCCWVSYYPGL